MLGGGFVFREFQISEEGSARRTLYDRYLGEDGAGRGRGRTLFVDEVELVRNVATSDEKRAFYHFKEAVAPMKEFQGGWRTWQFEINL
jgi:hypothetical protein